MSKIFERVIAFFNSKNTETFENYGSDQVTTSGHFVLNNDDFDRLAAEIQGHSTGNLEESCIREVANPKGVDETTVPHQFDDINEARKAACEKFPPNEVREHVNVNGMLRQGFEAGYLEALKRFNKLED